MQVFNTRKKVIWDFGQFTVPVIADQTLVWQCFENVTDAHIRIALASPVTWSL